MNKHESYRHYTKELAKHGWHVMNMLHIDDIKDHINGGSDIVEMPSDEVLNQACAYVANKHEFYDYSECVEWAVEAINEWKKEDSK